jgi:hypothetical protein
LLRLTPRRRTGVRVLIRKPTRSSRVVNGLGDPRHSVCHKKQTFFGSPNDGRVGAVVFFPLNFTCCYLHLRTDNRYFSPSSPSLPAGISGRAATRHQPDFSTDHHRAGVVVNPTKFIWFSLWEQKPRPPAAAHRVEYGRPFPGQGCVGRQGGHVTFCHPHPSPHSFFEEQRRPAPVTAAVENPWPG